MNFDVQLRKRTNMKIMLLLTACFATTLIAIPINTDDDDVSSITDGIKDLGQPLTIGQSDIADQGTLLGQSEIRTELQLFDNIISKLIIFLALFSCWKLILH